MKRYAIERLLEWKAEKKRKPLILRGARQVGKTWLMQEFGRTHFENMAYVNFDNNERMKILFGGDYDIPRLIDGLQLESGQKISPQATLLVFDEVQEVPKALSSLKYFQENAPEYAIIAGGSLLGVALHPGTSFPVGKVDYYHLYPMSFIEFLLAVGEEGLVELLNKMDWDLIAAFGSTFADLLRKYYYVGGMPEAVAEYAETKDYARVRKIHDQILFTYEQDFSKHAPANVVPRIRNLWNSVPAQLSRENKKFSPGVVQKGSRLSDYEIALQWLLDCGLLHKVNQVSKPGMPLKSYETTFFKIFLNDVGLLSAKSELDVKTLLEGNRIFEEYKGALTEQYVLQEMVANGLTPYYWSSSGTAEVDFVFQNGSDIYPLEVKAEENLQSKSLKVYNEKYNPPVSLRTSMRDFRRESWLMNIPLYAISPGLFEYLLKT
ncbi:MAG: ATP-binding protein [Oscillospiraceae bacterium]|nr:ATP-binding protein [Oscillospiraceae bacterium]